MHCLRKNLDRAGKRFVLVVFVAEGDEDPRGLTPEIVSATMSQNWLRQPSVQDIKDYQVHVLERKPPEKRTMLHGIIGRMTDGNVGQGYIDLDGDIKIQLPTKIGPPDMPDSELHWLFVDYHLPGEWPKVNVEEFYDLLMERAKAASNAEGQRWLEQWRNDPPDTALSWEEYRKFDFDMTSACALAIDASNFYAEIAQRPDDANYAAREAEAREFMKLLTAVVAEYGFDVSEWANGATSLQQMITPDQVIVAMGLVNRMGGSSGDLNH